MSATRSKFLPSEDDFAQSVYSASLNYSHLRPGQGRWILVAALALLALLLLAFPASGEPVSKTHKHFQNNTPDASQRCAPTGVFPLPKFLLPTPAPKPVAERPPRVDRYWPERRMVVARGLGEPHRWVREQEKEAWRFVNSIGK